jgi:hypothetical protein
MKRRYLVTLCYLVFLCNSAFAQDGNLKFESLKLNSSPAFVLLGVEPDNIQRPSTPAKLIAGLQNAVVNQQIKPNLAFEISPYYLSSPKDESDKRFNPSYYLLDKNDLGSTIVKTLSLSLTTSETDQQTFGNLKSGTGTAFGLRFLLVDGKPGRQLQTWNNSYLKKTFYQRLYALAKAFQGQEFDLNLIIDRAIADFKENILPNEKFNTLSAGQVNEFTSAAKRKVAYDLASAGINHNKAEAVLYLFNQFKAASTTEGNELQSLQRRVNPLVKQGFMLEFAAGQALVFQNNNFEDAALAKTAFWLTPSYRWDISGKDSNQVSLLDLMGVVRYTLNNHMAGVDIANYLDAGIKGAITQNRWSGSSEFVYRYASVLPQGYHKNYTYRLTTGIDYKLSDAITFKFNFGTNFDGNTSTYTDPKKIFITGGLNFGFIDFKK